MGFVKMPEMLSSEVLKALAGNVYTVKDEPSPKDEMAATWKDFFKPEKKSYKHEEKRCVPEPSPIADDICSPKKVKFIFLLNNAVVINVNAVAEEAFDPS